MKASKSGNEEETKNENGKEVGFEFDLEIIFIFSNRKQETRKK